MPGILLGILGILGEDAQDAPGHPQHPHPLPAPGYHISPWRVNAESRPQMRPSPLPTVGVPLHYLTPGANPSHPARQMGSLQEAREMRLEIDSMKVVIESLRQDLDHVQSVLATVLQQTGL